MLNLPKSVSDILKNCKKHGISISGIVSGNAAVLKVDITNSAISKFITLQAMIRELVL